MRDNYRFRIDGQPPRLVRELATAEIVGLLDTGIYVIDDDGEDADTDAGMERLRIELIIRQLGV